MNNNYQLYISNNCGGCNKVVSLLKREKITVPTINVDDENYSSSFPLLIFPALVKNDKVISYGAKDIINHLKKDS